MRRLEVARESPFLRDERNHLIVDYLKELGPRKRSIREGDQAYIAAPGYMGKMFRITRVSEAGVCDLEHSTPEHTNVLTDIPVEHVYHTDDYNEACLHGLGELPPSTTS